MTPQTHTAPTASPMILSDRLLSLAQEAERAGCVITAGHLLDLAHSVFDDAGLEAHALHQ